MHPVTPRPAKASKPKLLFPTAHQSSARPSKDTRARSGEALLSNQSAASLSPYPMGIARQQVAALLSAGVAFTGSRERSQFMGRRVESLMVLIKTTKNIIRAADFRGDCCGARMQPSPRWLSTPRDICWSLTEFFTSNRFCSGFSRFEDFCFSASGYFWRRRQKWPPHHRSTRLYLLVFSCLNLSISVLYILNQVSLVVHVHKC